MKEDKADNNNQKPRSNKSRWQSVAMNPEAQVGVNEQLIATRSDGMLVSAWEEARRSKGAAKRLGWEDVRRANRHSMKPGWKNLRTEIEAMRNQPSSIQWGMRARSTLDNLEKGHLNSCNWPNYRTEPNIKESLLGMELKYNGQGKIGRKKREGRDKKKKNGDRVWNSIHTNNGRGNSVKLEKLSWTMSH